METQPSWFKWLYHPLDGLQMWAVEQPDGAPDHDDIDSVNGQIRGWAEVQPSGRSEKAFVTYDDIELDDPAMLGEALDAVKAELKKAHPEVEDVVDKPRNFKLASPYYDNSDEEMYHGSDPRNRDTIMREGLHPNDPTSGMIEGGNPLHPFGAYVTPDKTEALDYGSDVWLVDVSGLPFNDFGEDRSITVDIPPNRLTLIMRDGVPEPRYALEDDDWGWEFESSYEPSYPWLSDTDGSVYLGGPGESHHQLADRHKLPQWRWKHQGVMFKGEVVHASPRPPEAVLSLVDKAWSKQHKKDYETRRDRGQFATSSVKESVLTRQKRLDMMAEWPDYSGKVVHTYPDGWTLSQPSNDYDTYREGVLLQNCLGTQHRGPWAPDELEPYTDQGEGTYILRDQDTFPHLIFQHDPLDGPYDIAGRADSEPKSEYLRRVYDWHRQQKQSAWSAPDTQNDYDDDRFSGWSPPKPKKPKMWKREAPAWSKPVTKTATATPPPGLEICPIGGDAIDRWQYNEILGAKVNGQTVGTLEMGLFKHPSYGNEASVHHIEVHPDWRRHGIATALFNHAQERYGDEYGPIKHTLQTTDGSQWVQSLPGENPDLGPGTTAKTGGWIEDQQAYDADGTPPEWRSQNPRVHPDFRIDPEYNCYTNTDNLCDLDPNLTYNEGHARFPGGTWGEHAWATTPEGEPVDPYFEWKFPGQKIEYRPLHDVQSSTHDNKGYVKSADYQGWSNWETWNTKLMMDNDYELYQQMQKMIERGLTPEQLQQWAMKNVIGPHNRQAIEDAQEWNEIPEHDRLDHRWEDLKEKSPEAADIVDAFGMGEDVSDEEPNLIHESLVNWDEIYKSIMDEVNENQRYEQQSQDLENRGITFGQPGRRDEDNFMMDAWMKHHGLTNEEDRYRARMTVPFEHLVNGGSEYTYPDNWLTPETRGAIMDAQPHLKPPPFHGNQEPDYTDPNIQHLIEADPRIQELKQNGYDTSIHSVGWNTMHSIKHGKPNPYTDTMQQALLGQGHTPEQVQHIMRPVWRWDEATQKHEPIEGMDQAPQVDPSLDQPGDFTLPPNWSKRRAHMNSDLTCPACRIGYQDYDVDTGIWACTHCGYQLGSDPSIEDEVAIGDTRDAWPPEMQRHPTEPAEGLWQQVERMPKRQGMAYDDRSRGAVRRVRALVQEAPRSSPERSSSEDRVADIVRRFDEAGKLTGGWSCDGGSAALSQMLDNEGIPHTLQVGLYHWPPDHPTRANREADVGELEPDQWEIEHHHWIETADGRLIDPNGGWRGEPRMQPLVGTGGGKRSGQSGMYEPREDYKAMGDSPLWIRPSDEAWEGGEDGEMMSPAEYTPYSGELPAWQALGLRTAANTPAMDGTADDPMIARPDHTQPEMRQAPAPLLETKIPVGYDPTHTYWAYLNGRVAYGPTIHAAMRQVAAGSLDSHTVNRLSNLLAAGAYPHSLPHDIAAGMLVNGRPRILVSNADRNAVYDAVVAQEPPDKLVAPKEPGWRSYLHTGALSEQWDKPQRIREWARLHLAMAERSGDPQLDALIEQFKQMENLSDLGEERQTNDVWEGYRHHPDADPTSLYQNPDWAAGNCDALSVAFDGFMRQHGIEVELSRNIPNKPAELGYHDADESLYGYDVHSVSVVHMPSGSYMVDWTASQYGYQEFPMVQKLDDSGGWQREWSASMHTSMDGAQQSGHKEDWQPGEQAHFEYHCYRGHDSGDAEAWYRSHQPVTILRRDQDDGDWGTFEERGEEGTPRSYFVRFPDGHEHAAFEDELYTDPRFFSPDLGPGERPPDQNRLAG